MDPEIVKKAVKKHLPRGWTVKWVRPRKFPGERFYYASCGYVRGVCAHDEKTITCVEPINEYNLCVFLHECGHARMQHHKVDYEMDLALCEAEAESYAIAAAADLGIEIPKRYIAEAVRYVRDCIEAQPDACVDDHVLKFAMWA